MNIATIIPGSLIIKLFFIFLFIWLDLIYLISSAIYSRVTQTKMNTALLEL